MKVFRDLNKLNISSPVATIGIFDGVHRAHQALIAKLNEKAEELSGESTIVTLWPHPRIVLQKGNDTLKMLNTLEEKIARLDKAGVQNLVIIPFDKTFAGTDFNDFVSQILVNKLNIAHLVVGYNHHFGKNREGNFDRLTELSRTLNFGLSQQEPVVIAGEKVSSSVIRNLLFNGEVNKAGNLLGYRFMLHGKVVKGYQKGREMGFPTANIQVSDPNKLIPHNGVYAIRATIEHQKYKAMLNIGCRPTLYKNCEVPTIEANLFDFDGDLYNKHIEITFIERIRDEIKFNSLPDLKAQIERDKISVQQILSAPKSEE